MLNLSNFRFNMEHGAYFIKVETDDFECDLHNFANFVDMIYHVQKHELLLCWTMRQGHGIPQLPEPFSGLNLVFQDVDYLEISPRDPEMPDNQDDALDTISYIAIDDDLNEYRRDDIITQTYGDKRQERDYHILFRFHGGQMIRVGAREIQLDLTSKLRGSP